MSLENPKIWLCLITSDNELENIDEMTKGIWQYFDGICAVIHKQGGNDEVKNLLETRKKEGFVKEVEWNWHHSDSMNFWLHDKKIGLGDIFVNRDSCERLNPQFAQNLRFIVDELYKNQIWNCYQNGKLLFGRRWFNQCFVNGLHYGLMGLYGRSIDIKNINKMYEADENCAYSLRNAKRAPDHHIYHEIKYLLDYSANSNHLQLYFNDPSECDRKQWELYRFMEYLGIRGVKGVDGLKKFLTGKKEIDTELKTYLNMCRPFIEAYRYWGLGHTHDEIIENRQWKII